jgi:hypothetical protein
MLSSIHPLGERARNMRWGLTAGAYVVGSIAGGLVFGGLLGAAGWVVHGVAGTGPAVAGLLLAAAGLAGAGLDLGVGGLAIPTIHRQVNEDWLHRYRGWVYGSGFGFQLGLGVVTIVTTATIYVTFAAAFLVGLAGSLAGGATIGAVFGAARSAPILLVARVSRPEHLRSTHQRLHAAAPVWRVLAIGVPCLVALSLGGMAVVT